MHAITVIGYPGSGKSTALSIADDLDIPHVTMGDIVRERAQEALGEDPGSAAIGQWATSQRKTHGPQVMAEFTVDHLKSDPTFDNADTVVVEGVRGDAEMEVFDRLADLTCIYIYADPATRLERLVERGRDGEDEFTLRRLAERDHRESQWGLRELVGDELYDIRVDNTGPLEEFEETLTELFSSLRSSAFDIDSASSRMAPVATPDD